MVDILCPPYPEELPADYAARLGQYYNQTNTRTYKKKNGQYFTSTTMARFMASMSKVVSTHLRILDPGCGVGILSCALVEYLMDGGKTKSIELVLYEIDKDLIFYTETALNYLKEWAIKKGDILIDYSIHSQDFIVDNNYNYKNFDKSYFHANNLFHIVISNPPYFKLKSNDKRVLIAENILGKQPNIYSIFIAVATTLLRTKGELIFVIPRSFTSGYYYTSFRNFLLIKLQLDQIHLFTSRRFPFQIDNVLQETIIIKASRVEYLDSSSTVVLSNSIGLKDLNNSIKKTATLNQIIKLNSSQKIIHLPINELEDNIISVFDLWNEKLEDYGISVSTGPVVDFRSLDFLRNYESLYTVPLFWLNNVQKMKLIWPIVADDIKKFRPQFIKSDKQTKSRLIKTQNCILIRRFSSKDEISRLVATPLFKSDYSQFEYLGVENHLNYIYKKETIFTVIEILGISAILNSFLFDIYFRTFNGNTNVSSTELRNIPMPPYHKIIEVGNQLLKCESITQLIVDNIISDVFNFQLPIPNLMIDE